MEIKEEKLLLKPKDFRPSSECLKVLGAFNPAAVRLPNGDIALYVRILERLKETNNGRYFFSPRCVGKNRYSIKIDKFHKSKIVDHSDLDIVFRNETKRLTFISHLRKIILDKTGFKVKSIEQKPAFYGLLWDGELGIEDARITKIGGLYVMTYVGLGRDSNVSTSMAISNDCERWYRRGIIFKEQNKDVVIFPEKINGRYVAVNRPEGSFSFTSPHMWISYSNDLEYWGKPHPLILSKKGWDSGRVGAGPPPIKIDKGWLLIYHGVIEKNIRKKIEAGVFKKIGMVLRGQNLEERHKIPIYTAGAVLLDSKSPRKKLRRTHRPILYPSKEFSKVSFENKEVIFPTGIVMDENEKDVLLFSGEGDVATSVRKVSVNEILRHTERV